MQAMSKTTVITVTVETIQSLMQAYGDHLRTFFSLTHVHGTFELDQIINLQPKNYGIWRICCQK